MHVQIFVSGFDINLLLDIKNVLSTKIKNNLIFNKKN